MAYEGLTRPTPKGPLWTGKVVLVAKHLANPIRWKRPRRIFVNSMSDMFHENLTNETIAAIFGVMAAAPHHTFQVLTKRPERMREWFKWLTSTDEDPWTVCLREAMVGFPDDKSHVKISEKIVEDGIARDGAVPSQEPWPLPWVWLGVSAENQVTADERIPLLLETPAAVRFISYEPALGPLELKMPWLPWRDDDGPGFPFRNPSPHLSWVIAGSESGPGARPAELDWYRDLRDQCKIAEVKFFMKQMVIDGQLRKDISEFPEDLRIMEWPRSSDDNR